MENKKLVILIVLGVLAVISLSYGIVAPPKRKSASSSDSQEASLQPAAGISGKVVVSGSEGFIPAKRERARSSFNSWKRSPFVPQSLSGNKSLVLNGILWDQKDPKAIINDKIVGVGDTVAKHRVIEIKKDQVILGIGTERIEIKLR